MLRNSAPNAAEPADGVAGGRADPAVEGIAELGAVLLHEGAVAGEAVGGQHGDAGLDDKVVRCPGRAVTPTTVPFSTRSPVTGASSSSATLGRSARTCASGSSADRRRRARGRRAGAAPTCPCGPCRCRRPWGSRGRRRSSARSRGRRCRAPSRGRGAARRRSSRGCRPYAAAAESSMPAAAWKRVPPAARLPLDTPALQPSAMLFSSTATTTSGFSEARSAAMTPQAPAPATTTSTSMSSLHCLRSLGVVGVVSGRARR